jgi:hypothetical protein
MWDEGKFQKIHVECCITVLSKGLTYLNSKYTGLPPYLLIQYRLFTAA